MAGTRHWMDSCLVDLFMFGVCRTMIQCHEVPGSAERTQHGSSETSLCTMFCNLTFPIHAASRLLSLKNDEYLTALFSSPRCCVGCK